LKMSTVVVTHLNMNTSSMTPSLQLPMLRWNGLILPGEIQPRPVLTIRPTEALIGQYTCGKRIPILITGTDSFYDNTLTYAYLQWSANTLGYRPNFQLETGTMMLITDMTWQGYPRKLGQVQILALDSEIVDDDDNEIIMSEMEFDDESNDDESIDDDDIVKQTPQSSVKPLMATSEVLVVFIAMIVSVMLLQRFSPMI